MERSVRLKVEDVGKRYQKSNKMRPHTLMQAALNGFPKKYKAESYWALRKVSFELSAGEALGVLGHNGAGKSTLLQLLGAVTLPEEGRISTFGRIGALLDLGAGFHGELTGEENLEVAGLIAGMTRKEIRERRDEIVEFSELADIIDNPLRTYSTGSRMRLAFAVAVHNDPQLLLVDEHLSVGDVSFRRKCIQRILELKNNGCAIVFVSQNPQQILEICETALLLDKGQVVQLGPAEDVANHYIRLSGRRGLGETDLASGASGEAAINNVKLALSPFMLDAGAPLKISVDYSVRRPLQQVAFGIRIVNANGLVVFDTNTRQAKAMSELECGPGSATLFIERLDLASGEYSVRFTAYDCINDQPYAYGESSQALIINTPGSSQGLLVPPCRWSINSSS